MLEKLFSGDVTRFFWVEKSKKKFKKANKIKF